MADTEEQMRKISVILKGRIVVKDVHNRYFLIDITQIKQRVAYTRLRVDMTSANETWRIGQVLGLDEMLGC